MSTICEVTFLSITSPLVSIDTMWKSMNSSLMVKSWQNSSYFFAGKLTISDSIRLNQLYQILNFPYFPWWNHPWFTHSLVQSLFDPSLHRIARSRFTAPVRHVCDVPSPRCRTSSPSMAPRVHGKLPDFYRCFKQWKSRCLKQFKAILGVWLGVSRCWGSLFQEMTPKLILFEVF